VAQIINDWEIKQERRRKRRQNVPLISVLGGAEYEEPERQGCLMCSL